MPDNDINDQLRQKAHAAAVNEQVRQRKLTPEERAQEKNDSVIENLRAELKQLRADLAGMRITGAGFSGEGPRGISYSPGAEGAGAGTGGLTIGQWYSLTLCDGTTLDVWASNIVSP